MIPLELYQGKVISNDDSSHPDGKKLGRAQIKVLPEHKDVNDSQCPWFYPFLATKNTSEYSFDPPPIGSLVFILSVPEFVGGAFYLPASFINGFFDADSIDTELGSVSEISAGSYPQLSFNKTSDGSIMFHNKTNGAMGILHKSGSYIVISESGDIVQRSSSTSSIQINTDGTIVVAGEVSLTGEIPGSGTVETGPTSAGDPSSIGTGAFLAVPTCVVTGAPISCYKITGT